MMMMVTVLDQKWLCHHWLKFTGVNCFILPQCTAMIDRVKSSVSRKKGRGFDGKFTLVLV